MAARFNDYRVITARFASTASCGHPVKKGAEIAWAPRTKETQCADCWRRWSAENAEADLYEATAFGGGY